MYQKKKPSSFDKWTIRIESKWKNDWRRRVIGEMTKCPWYPLTDNNALFGYVIHVKIYIYINPNRNFKKKEKMFFYTKYKNIYWFFLKCTVFSSIQVRYACEYTINLEIMKSNEIYRSCNIYIYIEFIKFKWSTPLEFARENVWIKKKNS